MKRPTISIEEPARKWQHAEVTIEIPAGWELNYEWGRYAPVKDLSLITDEHGNISRVVIGLRRSIHDAVPATKGELV